MAIQAETSGHFGRAFAEAVNKRGMTLREVAKQTDHAYEHMRKLVRNEASPSQSLLEELCKLLKLPPKEMEALVLQDKVERKYGDALRTVKSENPILALRLRKLEKFVEQMTEEQFELFVGMGKQFIATNRKAKA